MLLPAGQEAPKNGRARVLEVTPARRVARPARQQRGGPPGPAEVGNMISTGVTELGWMPPLGERRTMKHPTAHDTWNRSRTWGVRARPPAQTVPSRRLVRTPWCCLSSWHGSAGTNRGMAAEDLQNSFTARPAQARHGEVGTRAAGPEGGPGEPGERAPARGLQGAFAELSLPTARCSSGSAKACLRGVARLRRKLGTVKSRVNARAPVRSAAR